MDRRTQDELLEVLDALRQQAGPNGLIVPVGSIRYHPSAVVVSGFAYPLGLVARTFADPEMEHVDLSSPHVLVYDGLLAESIQLRYGLVPVLEQLKADKARRPLAVFALDLDGIVLEALVNSHRRNVCTIAAISCAGMERETGRHYLHTIARTCGASVLGAATREGPAWSESLGSAGRILADPYRTIVIEPARVDRAQLAAQSIGLLSVGGHSQHDMREGIEWIEGLLGR
jgi:hypothetical protein